MNVRKPSTGNSTGGSAATRAGKPAMIFHVAYRLNPDAKSASGIRPIRMRDAFKAIGYEVHEISGTHTERKRRIAELRKRIEAGLAVDFVYAESATAPTGLGEPVTRDTSFTRDIAFLRFCTRRGIPVGLFYRDIYWRFPIYTEAVKWPLSAVMRAFHRWDLRKYRRAGIDVYLPSMEMAKWVPTIPPQRFRELPPGGEPHDAPDFARTDRIRLLYVGGLGSNYRLHETVREIAGRDDAELTICTREAEWEARQAEYDDLMGSNIRVVHESGEALKQLYSETDVCVLAVEPIVYWEFAVPMKLLEYVAHGKPVIASDGSFSGRFVREQGVGWTITYGSGELGELLGRLHEHPQELAEAAERVRAVRDQHTWEARARQVARDLAGVGQS